MPVTPAAGGRRARRVVALGPRGKIVAGMAKPICDNILEAIPYNAANPALSARVWGTAGSGTGTPTGTPAVQGP